MARLICCLLAFAPFGAARADTFLVQPDGGGDFPTIQAAVDAATDGDEILLADGVFSGAGNHGIDYLGKAIAIRSASGIPSAAIVDCESDDPFGPDYRGFFFRSGEGPGSVLSEVTVVHSFAGIHCDDASPLIENVTLRDGWAPTITGTGGAPVLRGCVIEANTLVNTRSGFQGTVALHGVDATIESCTIQDNGWNGIRVRDSSPTLRDCVVAGNYGAYGGGIEIVGQSSPRIEGCTITGNRAISKGGGLYVSTSIGTMVTVEGCTIAGNWTAAPHPSGRGGGFFVTGGGTTTLEGCTITGNHASMRGGGLYVAASGPTTVDACTITANQARYGGGVFLQGPATLSVERTIFWGSCASITGSDLYLGPGTAAELGCVDLSQDGLYVYGNATLIFTGDVLDADPLFCLPLDCDLAPDAGGIYTLSDTSPVLTHACGPMGALGAGCTISIEPLSWGAIKARYR